MAQVGATGAGRGRSATRGDLQLNVETTHTHLLGKLGEVPDPCASIGLGEQEQLCMKGK